MKIFITLLISIFSLTCFALERGINYDPAHSKLFLNAQKANDTSKMKEEISKDLNVIKNSGFNIIKTFYSSFSGIDGKNPFKIAELACPQNIRMILGVYEFNPDHDNCSNWCEAATKVQVQNAIDSVKNYGSCIEAIAVGNEDIYNWNFTNPNKKMQERIAKDIVTIKQAIGNGVPVGSAQQDGAWLKLADEDPSNLIGKLDFIGVNIYPFWSPQKPNVEQGKSEFMARYLAIKNNSKYSNKEIIVTEEGWPSQSNSGQNPNANIQEQTTYYNWWESRSSMDEFDSYYFSIFDKQPTTPDADKYFGLCEEDRRNKILHTCQ